MEREEKKTMGMSIPVQMAKVMGNQAVVQMCDGDGDSDWGPGPEDYEQMKRDRKDDRIKKEQYLDPSKLRTDLGGGAGGEAHHIIPSCVAEKKGYNADDCNKAWNGILLPGTNVGDNKNALSTPETLPYHRKGGNRDHPEYTEKVREALKHSAPVVLAADFKRRIIALGAGKYIDDI